MQGTIVKHNGTTITGFVERYEREHKICTGIGTLNIEIVDTIGREFKPWDTIDIYENSSFQVRYYITSVEDNAPRGTYVLDCQDISKRLVDYFIPDSYTIDYPSYTRYWIELFLNEAGVEAEFTTSSPGNLLSNYTQLGLVTVYEQVTTLLQMSGWYMYFDGNEKAIIGTLDTDLAESGGSLGRTDILEILVTSNDKMLRNKAIVLGAYDVYAGSYASAIVERHTPWNYDTRDKRTVVISNSNIPDSATAYGMANQIIKEFARITVEKHITSWGARSFNLGEMISVSSNIWRGTGMVTTFGTSLSKDGLITRVILDERCPRLFGFFDFGDYVYVATYGEGVWRKHIKFDPTWYDFSTGFTDLRITDMHINNGVFGAVGASGQAYYAIDGLPWHEILQSGFVSSLEDHLEDPTASGEEKFFSGVMARAVIVDKMGNTVKMAYDNASGLNYGDYFLDYAFSTVSGVIGSGIASSGGGNNFGGKRSWIVDYDVVGGNTAGIVYPISLDGEYAYTVIDLENDGKNDFVSVATSGQIIPTVVSANFGYNIDQPAEAVHDPHNYVAYNLYSDFSGEDESIDGAFTTALGAVHSIYNNESNGDREIIWLSVLAGTRTLRRVIVNIDGITLSTTTLISPSLTWPSIADDLCFVRITPDIYRLYIVVTQTPGLGEADRKQLAYFDWDTSDNTVSAYTLFGDVLITDDESTHTSSLYERTNISSIVVNGIIYVVSQRLLSADIGSFSGTNNQMNSIGLKVLTCAAGTTTTTVSPVFGAAFQTREGTGTGSTRWRTEAIHESYPSAFGKLYQVGEKAGWHMYLKERGETGAFGTPVESRTWFVGSRDLGSYDFDATVLETSTDWEGTLLDGTTTTSIETTQLTKDYIAGYIYDSTKGYAYAYNGLSVTILPSVPTKPFSWVGDNIRPIFGTFDYFYIAFDPDTSQWYQCNPGSWTASSLIEFPANYNPVKPFSTTGYFSIVYYWQCYNVDLGKTEILRYSTTGYMGSSIKPFSSPSFSCDKGQIHGNFFLDYDGTDTTVRWLYLDNPPTPIQTTIYQVLRRDEEEFQLIDEEITPIRLDISNYSPLVTVRSGEQTFRSYFVGELELTEVMAVPSGAQLTASGRKVNDYRYTYLEPFLGGSFSSGLPISATILYVAESGVFAGDAYTYSGGFALMQSVPSGEPTRIETSNFGVGGQYIFITASGFTQTFYQQDPGSFSYVEYAEGLPQSRATIIRLDDRM